MWYMLERTLIEGACGATSALMGMDISDMLRRRSVFLCTAAIMDSGRAPERMEAVLEAARWSGEKVPVRLGHESVGCRVTEAGLE